MAPISGTAALVPLGVDLAAGHRPGPVGATGLLFALTGVSLASWQGRGPDGEPLARGAVLAVLAAFAFGVFFVGMDAAAESGVWWPVTLGRCAALVVLVVTAAARGPRSPRLTTGAVTSIAAVGVLDVGANVLFVAALGQGLAGVVSVLGSLYPLTTVALAWLLLRERASTRQWLGAVGALAGVALVTLSR